MEFFSSNFIYQLLGFLSYPLLLLWHLNHNIIVNQQFIGRITPGLVVQNMIAFSLGGGIWYYLYLKIMKEDELEERGCYLESYLNMSHIFFIVLNRAATIAVKYGLYSDENIELRRKIKFSFSMLISDLSIVTLADYRIS